ncbi:MAG: hypothetical protein PHR55_01985 [Bacilli bacterium]|nr:hypothetical protein [Bacilli bacterium]
MKKIFILCLTIFLFSGCSLFDSKETTKQINQMTGTEFIEYVSDLSDEELTNKFSEGENSEFAKRISELSEEEGKLFLDALANRVSEEDKDNTKSKTMQLAAYTIKTKLLTELATDIVNETNKFNEGLEMHCVTYVEIEDYIDECKFTIVGDKEDLNIKVSITGKGDYKGLSATTDE